MAEIKWKRCKLQDKAAIFCPTEMELKALSPAIRDTGLRGFVCGVGPVSTAYYITRFLENETVPFIILAGIGGSYLEKHLLSEKVFVAESEILADLGRCAGDKIEMFDVEGEEIHKSFFLIHHEEDLAKAISGCQVLRLAPMATVSCSSGSIERANMIAGQFGVEIENMEGAAAALVCSQYGVRLLELRTVSNFAGDSNKLNWNIKGALELLIEGVKQLSRILNLKGGTA